MTAAIVIALCIATFTGSVLVSSILGWRRRNRQQWW